VGIAILAFLVGGAESEPDPGTAPTLAELKKATYTGFDPPRTAVTLKNGSWEQSKAHLRVTLVPELELKGDLDGDGIEEAVALLAVSAGGSGTFDYLAVMKRTAKGVTNVATVALGDRVHIRSARIDGSHLLLRVLRAGPDDAMCCPGELADVGWTFAKGRLTPIAETGVSRLSLEAMTGVEWVLKSWGLREKAPGSPEVTLTYQNGRLSGNGGCNRYNAAADDGDSPGEFSVSGMALTRMACPAAEAAVEARFIEQLGAATSFRFFLGGLSIDYAVAGKSDAMLFETRAARPAPDP
jgi:heat shock protein HslJ